MLFVLALFWFLVLFVLWTFFLYPAMIVALSRLRPKPWLQAEFTGKASLIVAAHNEETSIGRKVENSISLESGKASLEVIIVSDGSTDATNTILASFDGAIPRLKIVTYAPRAGKATALKEGIARATGDILVFSDANVTLSKEALVRLLEPFADPQVGAVCGRVLVRGSNNNEIAGESGYMKYEGIIQRAEARFFSMTAIDGALFALRKELYRELPSNIVLDDFALSMEANLAGMRIVYASNATGFETMEPKIEDEFKRKARIVAGGFQYLTTILFHRKGMKPWMWFCFGSHKVVRWLSGWALAALFLCTVALRSLPVYQLFLAIQVVCYAVALCAHVLRPLRRNLFFYFPYYFCVVNFSAMVGLVRFLRGTQQAAWQKVAR